MNTWIKRMLSLTLALCLCLTILPFMTNKAEAITQSEFDSALASLRVQYPNYSTWTDSFDGGTQCFGFARLMGYKVFGTYPSTWTKVYDINSVKAGDLVQYGNTSGSGHTIFVTSVSGSTITFVDCNGNGNYTNGVKQRTCGIKWDNTIQIGAQMFGKYSFSYILSGPGIDGNSTSSPTPTPTPTPTPSTSSPIVHMDYPTGSYGLNNNIEVKGWIASNEPITWILCDIDNYGQISLGMWDSPDEAAQYPQYQYFKRFNGVIEASKLSAGQTYGYHVFTSVSGGEYWGEFSTNGTTADTSGDWKIHLDTPTGTHTRYDHIEIKGWLACNEMPAYIMSELVGKRQWVMNFWVSEGEAMDGYQYFIRFATVIDVNILEQNQSYTILVWSSLGGTPSFTFQTDLPDPEYYPVTYDANGGSNAPVAQSKKQLAPLTLSSDVPTRAGYTFVGWATSSDATAAEYQPGAEFTTDADTVLYAVWEEGCGGSHSYSYSVYEEPSANNTGALKGECNYCGATTSVTLPMLSDECYTFNVEYAPDCESQGTGRYTWNVTQYGVFYFDVVLPAIGHSYENGCCTVCGTADSDYVAVPALTLSYPTLSFEDEILYNAYFTVDDTSSIVEMGMITFASKLTDGTIADAVEVIPGYYASGSSYVVTSNGIPAKNLGDALYFKVYAKLSDGTYAYSDVAGYNAVAYAKTILNSASSSANAKALVVAMLNYGAAAQTYFGYNTSSLMNASLTADQQALVSAYDDGMIADVVKADANKIGSFVSNGGYTNIWPAVSFEGAFSINYYFTLANAVDPAPTLYYWDAETYSGVSALSPWNATDVITMAQDGSNWSATVDGIAAKSIDETIYVAGIYTSNGTTYCSGVIAYSLGKYCKTITDNGNTFGAATAVYGYYAKAYFA